MNGQGNITRRTKFCLCGLFCLILLFVFGIKGVFAQEGKKSYSVDDLLEYTLMDLRMQMQNVLQNNQKIASKNNSLRKRIFFLKQQLRDFENHKIELLENSLTVTDSIKLNTKEFALLKKELEDIRSYKIQLQTEQNELRQKIADSPNNQYSLKERILSLEGEIRDLRNNVEEKKVSTIKSRYAQEKTKYLELIRTLSKQNDRTRKQIVSLNSGVTSPQIQNDALLESKAKLQEQLSMARASYESEKKITLQLEDEAQKFRDYRQKAIEEFSEDLGQYQLYEQKLEAGINHLLYTRDSIKAEYNIHRLQMLESKQFLESEKQLLLAQDNVVTRSLDWVKRNKNGAQEAVRLKDEKQDLNKVKEGLSQEKENIQGKIGEQQKSLEAYWNDQKRLVNEIQGIENQLAKSRKTNLSLQRDGLKDQRAEVERSITRKKQQISSQRSQIEVLKQNISQNEKALEEAGKEKTSLLQRSAAESDSLKKLKDEGVLVEEEKGNLEKPGGISPGQKIRQEIKDLGFKEKILSNSLLVIESKYNTEELAVEGFGKEEQELRDYLKLLNEENERLKQKIFALTVTLDKLKGGSEKLEK